MKEYIFEKILTFWGVNKTIQIFLLAVGTASISIIIGASVIPNDSKEGECYYE